MKILHLSDPHNCHNWLRELPEADVVVHSGDFCMAGTEQEALDFVTYRISIRFLFVVIMMSVCMERT